jgi:hypothetical protein
MKLSTLIMIMFGVFASFLLFVEIMEPGSLKEAILSEAPEPLDKYGPPEPYEGYWSNEASADYAAGNYPNIN